MKKLKFGAFLFALLVAFSAMLSGCSLFPTPTPKPSISLDNIPPYSNSPYVIINSNVPFFTESEITDVSFESYSELDSLGRCGVAVASVGIDIMPTEDRGSIGMIKPSGWHSVRYEIITDGKYLYNRCHLIAYRLTGENANTENLITGTRYMNTLGMIPFEDMVADYVIETENHVMYRVTPIFEGNELVARGVLIEAYSVEDDGDGVCFNVYVYNVQPGITINYLDGTSALSGEAPPTATPTSKPSPSETPLPVLKEYILNTNSMKIHLPSCRYAKDIKEENKKTVNADINGLLAQGYTGCGACKPE